MKTIIEKRIRQVNNEYKLTKASGGDTTALIRRARNLTAVWRGLEEA